MDRKGRRVFDGHLHVIDPRFPLEPNRGYLPDFFTVEDYLERTVPLHGVGGAVISGSFQAFDQGYLIDALKRLGPSFVGVTQLPASVPDEEVLRLHAAGVRAVRFNLYRGGSESLDYLERLALRVHDLAGWHAELYVDSKDLPELGPRLATLPGVAIDHLGMTRDGFSALLRLVERGVKVKATGFGRVELDVPEALRKISSVDPGALIFGTDLPGTRAERPFEEADIDLIVETLGEPLADRVLHENALDWYLR
ncbi:MAG: amidohydrolase family protein [Actinobacteria bacterium]|nr:amidohydrolase family protein [Actinomycetota bacterium]MCA1739686.1 amidohydrolase family protein [Actinomycetota bacterium]